MGFLKQLWKYSSIRFYFLNLYWNISFWLFCKKIYKNINYEVNTDDFFTDDSFKLIYIKKKISKKRFYGYLYKNRIYLDNPGLQIKDRDVWNNWKSKGLINF